MISIPVVCNNHKTRQVSSNPKENRATSYSAHTLRPKRGQRHQTVTGDTRPGATQTNIINTLINVRIGLSESLRRGCKREFGSGRPGDFPPHCDLHVNTSLSHHIMTFHLALGQLWRCPILSNGALCGREPPRTVLNTSVSGTTPTPLWWPASWANAFRSWTVTRATWTAALGPKVSGIATDLMLFSSTQCPACSPVPGVRWQSTSPVTTWILHGEALSLHPPGLCRGPLGGQTWPGFQFGVCLYTSRQGCLI